MEPNNYPKNKWGNKIYIPKSQEWYQIMKNQEEQERAQQAARRAAEALRRRQEEARRAQEAAAAAAAALQAEKNALKQRLRELNALAEAAPLNVQNPKYGNFKKNASGQLYRWTKKTKGPGYQRQKNSWQKVSRQLNYEPNLQVYLNRVAKYGSNYQTRRRNRRQARKSRKNTRS